MIYEYVENGNHLIILDIVLRRDIQLWDVGKWFDVLHLKPLQGFPSWSGGNAFLESRCFNENVFLF